MQLYWSKTCLKNISWTWEERRKEFLKGESWKDRDSTEPYHIEARSRSYCPWQEIKYSIDGGWQSKKTRTSIIATKIPEYSESTSCELEIGEVKAKQRAQGEKLCEHDCRKNGRVDEKFFICTLTNLFTLSGLKAKWEWIKLRF